MTTEIKSINKIIEDLKGKDPVIAFFTVDSLGHMIGMVEFKPEVSTTRILVSCLCAPVQGVDGNHLPIWAQ